MTHVVRKLYKSINFTMANDLVAYAAGDSFGTKQTFTNFFSRTGECVRFAGGVMRDQNGNTSGAIAFDVVFFGADYTDPGNNVAFTVSDTEFANLLYIGRQVSTNSISFTAARIYTFPELPSSTNNIIGNHYFMSKGRDLYVGVIIQTIATYTQTTACNFELYFEVVEP